MHEWEVVAQEGTNRTERMRVPGGWLYRDRWGSSVSMTFVDSFDPDTKPSDDQWDGPDANPRGLERDAHGRFKAAEPAAGADAD